jgi:hypothetical protein
VDAIRLVRLAVIEARGASQRRGGGGTGPGTDNHGQKNRLVHVLSQTGPEIGRSASNNGPAAVALTALGAYNPPP